MRFISLVIVSAAITVALAIGLGLGASSALALERPATPVGQAATFEVAETQPVMFLPGSHVFPLIERYCLDLPRPDGCR